MSDLGQLLLKLGVDESELINGLEKARQRVASIGTEIEKSLNISVNVEDKALTGLNKHLDLKTRHLDQVQRHFDTHPLTVKTDERSLTQLNKKIEDLRKGVVIPVSLDTKNARTTSGSPTDSSKGTQVLVKEISSVGKSIVKAIADQGKKSVGQQIVSAVTAPIKVAGNVASSIVGDIGTGALEKVGRDLSADLSKGLSSGLKQELSYTIGSLDYIGEQIGRDVVKGITSALGRDADVIEQAIADVFGKQTIAKEGAAVRGRATQDRRDRSAVAKQQIGDEGQFVAQNLPKIKVEAQQVSFDRNRLEKSARKVQKQIDDYAEKLGQSAIDSQVEEIGKAISGLSDRAQQTENPAELQELASESRTLGERRNRLRDRADAIAQTASDRFRNELNVIDQIDEQLLVRERQIDRYSKAIDAAASIGVEALPTKPKAASNYRNPGSFDAIARQVADRSGVGLSQSQIPNLVSSENVKALAQYVPNGNKIEVPPALYEGIKRGELTAKEIETVVHELRHAVQLGFGSRSATDERGAAIPLIDPTFEESRRLGRRIEGSVGPTSDRRVRGLEQDAYVFADRFASEISESITRAAKAGKFVEEIGAGGGRIERQVYGARNTAARFAIGQRKKGIGSDQELDSTLDQIDKVTKGFSADIESLVNIDLLPTNEIESAGQELNRRMRASIDALKDLATNYGKVAVDLQPQLEAELVPVPVRSPQNNQARSKSEQSRTGSNSFASQARTRLNRQTYSPVSDIEKASSEVSQQVAATQKDIDEAIAGAKGLSDKFVGLYSFFKELVEEGDLEQVEALQSDIARYAAEAQNSIDEAIARAKSLDTPDNSLVNRLGGQKGQIGRKVKLSEQAVIKLRSQQGGDAEALQSVDDIVNDVRDYLDGVSKKVKEKLNPDRVYEAEQLGADVSARQAQRDLDISSAESDSFRNAERVQSDIDKKLSKIGAGETLGDRVNRVIKANVGDNAFISELTGKVSGLLGGLTKFAVFSATVSLFGNFAQSSIEVAASFQQIETKLKFVTGSATAATAAIEKVRDRSNSLGTNFDADIAGFAQLQAAGRGTALEGAGIDELAESFQKATSVYQLNTEQQDRAYTALEQILSKGKLSAEELRGQLSEALPGSFQIAARAIGVTTQELDKMLQQGEVLSNDFLPKFARQLAAENYIGLADSSNTYTASLNRLSNEVSEIQQRFGEGLIPAKQIGLDALNKTLAIASENMGAVVTVIATLSTALTAQLAISVFKVISALKILPAVAAIAKGGLVGLGAAMGPTIAVMAALAAAAAAVQIAMQVFGDSSGDAGRLAKQSSNGFEALKDQLNGVEDAANKANKALKAEGILGKLFNKGGAVPEPLAQGSISLPGLADDNFINRALNFNAVGAISDRLSPNGRSLNERIVDAQVNKQSRGRLEAVSQSGDRASEVLGTINNISAGRGVGGEQLAVFNQLAQQLKAVRVEQQAVQAIAPENVKLLQELKDREASLLEQQGRVASTVNLSTSELEKELRSQNEILESLERDFESGLIDSDAFQSGSRSVQRNINALTKAQEQFNQALDDGSRSFAELARRSEDIRAVSSDQNLQLSQQESAARSELLRSNLSPAQRQSGLNALSETRINAQLEATQNAINAIKSQLQSSEISGVLGSLGIRDAGSVGPAQLQLLQSRSGDSTEIQTAVGLLQNLKELEAEAGQLGEESAQAVSEITQQVNDTDKAMKEYFQEILNQTESVAIETERSQSNLSLAQAKRDINKAITGVTGSFVSGFGDLLVELIEAFNEPLQASLDAQSSLLDVQFQRLQALNQNDAQRLSLGGGYGAVRLDAQGRVIGGGGGSGSFSSPIQGRSLDEVVDYQQSAGQDFNAYRAYRSSYHGGIDFDARVGGGEGGVVQAVTDGVVSEIRAIADNAEGAGGSIQVRIESVDSLGQAIEQRFTHLSRQSVAALGITEGAAVAAGQQIGTVGGTDTVSSGPHLDYKVTVNGQFVDPDQFLGLAGVAGNLATLDLGSGASGSLNIGQLVGSGQSSARSQPSSQGRGGDRLLQGLSERFSDPLVAAAFYGNFQQESGGDPTITNSIGAFGLAQFLGSRKDGLQSFARGQGTSAGNLETQLDFVVKELQSTESAAASRINEAAATGQLENVVYAIRKYYERPGEHEANDAARNEYAREAIAQLGSAGGAGGGLNIPGSSANNLSRLGLDSAAAARYNGQLDQSAGQINLNFDAQKSNIGRDLQARLAQAEIQRENALRQITQLTGEAKRQMEDLYREGNREFQDLVFESLPDNIDTQSRQEIQEVLRRQEDDTRGLLDELEKYQNTLTEASQTADATRAQIANGTIAPGDGQRIIEDLGELYTQAKGNIGNIEERLLEVDNVYDDILNELLEAQTRAGQQRLFDFRQQSEGLEAEFTRISTIRAANIRGDGLEGINLEADTQRAEVELRFDEQVRSLEEQQRAGERTTEQVKELTAAFEGLARAELEGITRETEKLAEALLRISGNQLFETEGQLIEAQVSRAGSFGVGSSGLPEGLQRDRAIATQTRSSADEIDAFVKMAEDAGVAQLEISRVKAAMEELNEVRLSNIREEFGQFTPAIAVTRDATEGLFSSLFDRTKTVGEAFRGFFENIIDGFAQLAAKQVTDEIFGSILGTSGAGGNGTFGAIVQGIGSIFNFADGGDVPNAGRDYDNYRQGYGAISKALSREGPNSVLAALTPGERVLTQRESNQYVQYKNLFNFAEGGLVPGAFTPAKASGMSLAVNLGGINTTVNNGGGAPVDPAGIQRAFERQAPAIVQAEINRQLGMGGSLEKEA